MNAPQLPLNFADVVQAAQRLNGMAYRTPLLEFAPLNAACGGRVLVKAETLQRTGAFKFRGAYNYVASLDAQTLARGVATFSSGNHGQAVALAAKLAGAKATVIMPSDAPELKIRGVRSHGADLILYDRFTEDREAIAKSLVERTGAVFISPYDDLLVMAGQGTLGLELMEQAQALGAQVDVALVPCGGGGLISGVATAIKGVDARVQVYGVEPAECDDTRRSLEAGERLSNAPTARSICDSLLTPTPGKLTFAVNQHLLEAGLAVSDEEVKHAMRWAFENLKLVIEPGGCVALAALLTGKLDLQQRTAAIVLSGGNVDPAFFANVLKEEVQ